MMRALRRSRLVNAFLLPGLLFLPTGAASALMVDACVYHEEVAPEAAAPSAAEGASGHTAHASHGRAAAAPATGHAHHGSDSAAAGDEKASGCDCDCLLLCAANAQAAGPARTSAAALPVAAIPPVLFTAHAQPRAPRSVLFAHFLPPAIAPPAT